MDLSWIKVAGNDDVVMDMNGKVHTARALTASPKERILPSDVLMIVRVGEDMRISKQSFKDSVEFSRRFCSPPVIRNLIRKARLRTGTLDLDVPDFIKNIIFTKRPARQTIPNSVADDAFRAAADGLSDADIHALLTQRFSKMMEHASISLLEEGYLRNLYKFRYRTENARQQRDPNAEILAAIYADQKEDRLPALVQGLPEWAGLIARKHGLIIATRDHKDDVNGASTNAGMYEHPLCIYLPDATLRDIPIAEAQATMREEVLHSVQGLSSTRERLLAPNEFRPDADKEVPHSLSMDLQTATMELSIKLENDPERAAKIAALIKKTEPCGGTLLAHGFAAEGAGAELLIDILEAQDYLRNKEHKNAADTNSELQALFGKDLVKAVHQYQDSWMQEGADIAKELYGPKKADALLAKWQDNPLSHTQELFSEKFSHADKQAASRSRAAVKKRKR